jgi:uncharacterized protein YjbI with pentapeptide repeats
MIPVISSFWHKIKTHPTITLSILIFLLFLVLIGGYKLNWSWTGFNGADKTDKTLYDWLQLLIVPAIIAFVGLWYSQMQKSTEQKIADDNQKEEALQGYINEMSNLLLEKNLRKSNAEDEASIIGRVRTLTILDRLDRFRKRAVIEFLYESGLIQKGNCIIKLKGADLRGAFLPATDLHDADLRGVLLVSANLNSANLCGSDISEGMLDFANLEKANLIDVNLSNANLDYANLEESNLTNADLSNANLDNVFLKGAVVTNEQLEKAKLLAYAPTWMNPQIFNK